MKTFSKIGFAVLGIVAVPLLFAGAALRRLFSGPALKAAAGRDVLLIYSQVIWDEVWQRPQEFAWRASLRSPAVYCSPVQMHNLLYLGRKWKPLRREVQGDRELIILSPLVFSGHFKNEMIHWVNSWIIGHCIRLALPAGCSLRILSNTPFGAAVLQSFFHAQDEAGDTEHDEDAPVPFAQHYVRSLVYDVIDDFTAFEWSPPFGQGMDAWLTARATRVIAGTHELAAARDGARFIPCGVDFELFSRPQPSPPEIASLPRPIIGYFGTISERIDLQLIDSLATALPEASLVLVGPIHFDADELPRRPNIHYPGLRRHEELPAFAQAFQVALIPFRITPATVKLNPVKTLEYLAAGVPVVATAIPDLVRYYSDLIAIAATPADFVEHVRETLANPDPEKIQAGIERARQSSWQAMADEIYACLFPDDTVPQDKSRKSKVDVPAASEESETSMP